MKKLFILLLTSAVAFSCGKVHDEYYDRLGTDESGGTTGPEIPPAEQGYWYEQAEIYTNVLLDDFWVANVKGEGNDSEGNWWFYYASKGSNTETNHWWPYAHAMDVVIDAYIRAREADEPNDEHINRYGNYFAKYFVGSPRSNWASNNWQNPYIDDMEWHVLTLLRLYEVTNDAQYLERAQQIYDDWIWSTWSETPGGGGILWCTTTSPSKNACSNGPAMIIAAKLHKYVSDETEKANYLSQAKRIEQWMSNVLVTSEGAVNDAINENGVISTYRSTYNQGTYLGGCHLLYEITGEADYLTKAIRVANWTLNSLASNYTYQTNTIKILNSEGSGDLGLFKGIFIRYFTLLTNDENVSESQRKTWSDFITVNAMVLLADGVNPDNNFFSNNWTTPPGTTTQLGMQVSACTLIEAMNRLNAID